MTSVSLLGEVEEYVQRIEERLPHMIRGWGLSDATKGVIYRIHVLAQHFVQSSWMLGADLQLEPDSPMTEYLITQYGELHRLVTSLKALGMVPEPYDLRPTESRISMLFQQLIAVTNCCY